jgi:hypothetical protein
MALSSLTSLFHGLGNHLTMSKGQLALIGEVKTQQSSGQFYLLPGRGANPNSLFPDFVHSSPVECIVSATAMAFALCCSFHLHDRSTLMNTLVLMLSVRDIPSTHMTLTT